MSKQVIAFAASNSRQSINRKLVTYAGGLLADAQVEVLDLNDFDLPLFSVDREAELGQPQPARAFLQKISDSDGITISFAEHNGAYSAAYKNVYDWVSRIKPKVYRTSPWYCCQPHPEVAAASRCWSWHRARFPVLAG